MIMNSEAPLIIFLLSSAYKNIATLRLKFVRRQNRGDYFENESHIIWKRPHFFKNINKLEIGGGTLKETKQFKTLTLVNKEFLIENRVENEKLEKQFISKIEKQMGFDSKLKTPGTLIESTYANYLALQNFCVYPISYLSDCDIEFIERKKHLDRDSLFIKAYPRNPVLYEMSGDDFHIVGDYENVLIDEKSGILLQEEMFSENTLIHSCEVMELEINKPIGDNEFTLKALSPAPT